jgi:Cu-Zn family superoxide dismutase
MKRTLLPTIFVAATLLSGCADDPAGEPAAPPSASEPAAPGDTGSPAATATSTPGPSGDVVADVQDVGGQSVGTVTLTAHDGAVHVEGSFEGLAPGFHGFHIHDVGLCEADAPEGPFTTAGGHYAGAAGAVHGAHAGDLPSLYVAEDGSGRLSFTTDAFTVEELLEGDGTAVMVHEGADNFANIPDRYTSSESGEPGPDETTRKTGDAGARAACGVLQAGS